VLAAFAVEEQDTVAVFFAEVNDFGAAGFGEAQPEQSEHRDQGEVEPVRRLACGGQDRFELQVGQPEHG
jgi:hypothetical protein